MDHSKKLPTTMKSKKLEETYDYPWIRKYPRDRSHPAKPSGSTGAGEAKQDRQPRSALPPKPVIMAYKEVVFKQKLCTKSEVVIDMASLPLLGLLGGCLPPSARWTQAFSLS